MSADLVPVPVPGTDRRVMAMLVDGKPMASLRHCCEAIGLAVEPQRRKLNGRSWACATQEVVQLPGDAQRRDVTMIDRRTFTMWLATIDENKVSEQARPVLIAFQSEAADALDSYFNKRTVVAAPALNQLDVLRAAIDQIEAAQRDAAEAKAIAQRTDERLAAIEGKHDWLSALAYARINDLPTHTAFLRKLGGCATRIAKAHDIEPNRVQHQLYGLVNSYPVWVWELAAEGFQS